MKMNERMFFFTIIMIIYIVAMVFLVILINASKFLDVNLQVKVLIFSIILLLAVLLLIKFIGGDD